MRTLDLVQGSPEWLAHRATTFNASDAPAMLGCSSYKKRSDLLAEVATGAAKEIDAGTQRRFDDGHRFEALARPLAEEIIGEDLFPVTGSEDFGLARPLSASFDGLTLMEDTAFEHKTLNDELRRCVRDDGSGIDLPKQYRAQMEQQCMVSGAQRVLFMATKWSDETLIEKRHCWYTPDPALRAEIIAGWQQFEADLANYVAEPAKAEVVAQPVTGFGALSLRVEGRVLASNLDAFKAGAEAFIARLPKPADLQTDQDFVNAAAAVTACSEAEERIGAARAAALAQMADVDTVLRTADEVREAIRAARLALNNVVKAEKENRRVELIRSAAESVRLHYASIAKSLGEYAPGVPASVTADLGAAIKGLKSLASIKDKLDATVAQIKIAASQDADCRRESITVIEANHEHQHLLPDRVVLVATKSPEDLRNLIGARVLERNAQEQARLEAERAQIREDEQRKARQEAERLAEKERVRIREEERQSAAMEASKLPAANTPQAVEASAADEAVPPSEAGAAPMPAGHRIKLGEINAKLAPLSITADGLASLGFKPVATDGNAKLYNADVFPRICEALIKRLAFAAGDMRKAA